MKRRAFCAVLALMIALQGPAAVTTVKATEVKTDILVNEGKESYEKEIV